MSNFLKFINLYSSNLKQNDSSYITNCPLCGAVGKFYIRKTNGQYKCFKCNQRETPINVCMFISGLDYREVSNFLKDKRNNTSSNDITNWLKNDEQITSEINEDLSVISLPNDFIPCNQTDEGSKYALKRNIPFNILQKFNCHYSDFLHRLITPITKDNQTVGWQGRDITGISQLKTLTYKFKKDKVLLGLDYVKGDTVFITEGPFDMFSLWRCGFESICLLGSSISKEQINLLTQKQFKNIIIALDNDAIEKALKMQSLIKNSKLKFPLKGKDFGEMTDEDIHESLKTEEIYFFPNLK